MFAVLLVVGACVIFQASSGEESLVNNTSSIKATESKFDLNTYYFDSRFLWELNNPLFIYSFPSVSRKFQSV